MLSSRSFSRRRPDDGDESVAEKRILNPSHGQALMHEKFLFYDENPFGPEESRTMSTRVPGPSVLHHRPGRGKERKIFPGSLQVEKSPSDHDVCKLHDTWSVSWPFAVSLLPDGEKRFSFRYQSRVVSFAFLAVMESVYVTFVREKDPNRVPLHLWCLQDHYTTWRVILHGWGLSGSCVTLGFLLWFAGFFSV